MVQGSWPITVCAHHGAHDLTYAQTESLEPGQNAYEPTGCHFRSELVNASAFTTVEEAHFIAETVATATKPQGPTDSRSRATLTAVAGGTSQAVSDPELAFRRVFHGRLSA